MTDPSPSATAITSESSAPAWAFPLAFVAILSLGLGYALGWINIPKVPDLDENTGLGLVFLAGLSVGGLSCLAVQGGLLAATIAQRSSAMAASGSHKVSAVSQLAPVSQFLVAKIAAYTMLGALLGLVGEAIGDKVPTSLQAWLIIAAGLLMLGIAAQLYDLHPLFRYLALKPPKAIRRKLRSRSKQGDAFGPAVLGAMTIFIPCGVTLGMEALAIASNDPIRGAQIMFAFTLGTSPLFLILGFMATHLGTSAYKVFKPLAATAIVLIGGLSIYNGMRLLAPEHFVGGGTATEATVIGDLQEQVIYAENEGYRPGRIEIKAGIPTQLTLVTEDNRSCTRAFVIPSLDMEEMLAETGEAMLELPAFEAGERIGFACSMGMFTGVIEVVQ